MRYIFLALTLITLSFAKVVTIHVEGMTCPLCTMAVKKSLKKINGVKKVKVRLNTKKATVYFDKNIDNQKFIKAIKEAGYSGKVIKK